jgi:hypothetical protein
MTFGRRFLLACFAILALQGASRAEPVDLLLVLAADVSLSVDEGEWQLQRQGYAEALQDPRVLRAIQSGPNKRIAICYFEWSGVQSQQIIVDWSIVDDEASAKKVADQLINIPRPFGDRTAIGAALDYAMLLLEKSPHTAIRRTIDVSGDGTNTNGRHPSLVRDEAVARGVTINGLVILSPFPLPQMPWHTHPPGGLDEYFRRDVAGGQGAFVMVAENFGSFAYAITNKLIREIAEATETETAAAR